MKTPLLSGISPRWIERVSYASVFSFLAVFLIPWIPAFFYPFPSVDDSWLMVLHYAFETHKRLGSDIVFYYGPFGFLKLWYYHHSTFPVVLAGYIFLFLVFAESSWRVLSGYIVTFWRRLACWAGIFILVAPPQEGFNFLLCVLTFLLFDLQEEKKSPPIAYFSILALAFIANIKFNFMLASVFTVFLISWSHFERCRASWVVPAYIFFYLGFWMLGGQQLSDLPAFLRGAWELTSGYSQAVCSPTTPYLHVPEVFYIAVLSLLIPLIFISEIRKSRAGAFRHALMAASVAFLVFKGLAVRFSVFFIYAPYFLSALVLLYGAFILSRRRGLFWQAGIAVVFGIALGGMAVSLGYFKINKFEKAFSNFGHISQKLEILQKVGFRKMEQEVLRSLAAVFPLPYVPGTTDIYSHRQGVLFANKLSYHPRPVIQSYLAYTRYLAELNAKFLSGPNAAGHIYFLVDPFDKRYPALDDGLSWPEIVSRYSPQLSNGEMMLMRRENLPKIYQLNPLSRIETGWNQTVQVPQSNTGLVWAKIKIRPSALNKLLSFLFKPVGPLMQIKMVSMRSEDFFVVPRMAEAGFLLSPFVRDTKSFRAAFYGGRGDGFFGGNAVIHVKFIPDSTKPSNWFFKDKIEIEFFGLEFKERPA